MRDRLIEIVKESLVKNIDYTHRLAENIADDLLANGVIVPPVKVGQTVYIADGVSDRVVEGYISHLEYNICTAPSEWITVVGNYPFFGELIEKNRIDLLIGKTVFLTREEAERALQERSEG